MEKRRLAAAGIAAAAFLIALGLTLYPFISNSYNQRHASQIHTEYQERIEQADTAELDSARMAAERYNWRLIPGAQRVDAYSSAALEAASEAYGDILNLSGNGLMGYLRIPKLDVELPIYHGTADATLEIGVGHLLGSSLPIGGSDTHAILSGHSGMAGNKMLSDLPEMEEGDLFYLEVLGEKLAYRVDQIKTVLPTDTSFLSIVPGEDYCTLVTCTPFGINTHRLLVRGVRTPYVAEEENEAMEHGSVETSSRWEQQYLNGILGGIALAAGILLVGWLALQLKKRVGRVGKYEA